MSKVIDDLIDVTRLDSNMLRIERKRLRLQDSILAAADAAGPAIMQRQQYFAVDVPTDPPLWVTGDDGRLQQVFANLLSNACRYSPEGAEISLSARRENDRALIVVRDTGIGIRRETLERIFDPFVREAGGGVEGIGIGLTLVRNLVTQHGGLVTAHSEGPGRGSTFVVELPLLDRGGPFGLRAGAVRAGVTRNSGQCLRVGCRDPGLDQRERRSAARAIGVGKPRHPGAILIHAFDRLLVDERLVEHQQAERQRRLVLVCW